MSLATSNELILQTGADIPFPQAQLTVHQPSSKEISIITEEAFWSACQIINFNRNSLSDEDKSELEDKTDFEILMTIMSEKSQQKYRNYILMLLTLLFPDYQIHLDDFAIVLIGEKGTARIDDTNYDTLKDIVVSMFDLNNAEGAQGDYNPGNARARKIAEKFRNRKKKMSGDKPDKVAILSRYISILAVGENKDKNELSQYTVWQLLDEMKRFQMHMASDFYREAIMAGAQDLEEVENWMDDIHPVK